MDRIPVFDLDGTLLDSDAALVGPFVALGVPAERVGFGMTLAKACADLGVSMDDYLANYEADSVEPFPGVEEMLSELDRWAVFSNKLAAAGEDDLARFGWKPEVALFMEAFGGPKTLGPVLDALALAPEDVICIGDSEHDRECARASGVAFAVAAWNPRATAVEGDIVLTEPRDVLALLVR